MKMEKVMEVMIKGMENNAVAEGRLRVLYELLIAFIRIFSPFNVFRYITFRTSLAALTGPCCYGLSSPGIIQWLKKISMTSR